MSVLVQIDKNDTENLLELDEGQYVYTTDHNTLQLLKAKTQQELYINNKPYHPPCNFTYFVLNPMTKLTLYDINQQLPKMQYSGNTLIIYNKSNKKLCVDLLLPKYAKYHLGTVRYIVVESLRYTSSNKSKQQLKNNKLDYVYIPYFKHNYKYMDEPIIETNISNIFAIVIAFIVGIILVSLLYTYFIKHYNNTNPSSLDTLLT